MTFTPIEVALLKSCFQWYKTKRRHLGYRMNKLPLLQKIEQWILNNKTNQLYQDEVSETLIRYRA